MKKDDINKIFDQVGLVRGGRADQQKAVKALCAATVQLATDYTDLLLDLRRLLRLEIDAEEVLEAIRSLLGEEDE
jgi:hypothetical protein